MEKLKKFINNDYENEFCFARNYFFAGTVFIILINILLFAIGGSGWTPIHNFNSVFGVSANHWKDVFYFNSLICAFCNSFAHFNWQHTLLNMLCFFACGLYLERKAGSIKFVLLVLAMAFFTSATVSANDLSVSWQGFSGVNYGLYAFIIVDYLFSLQKTKRTKFNLFFGGVILALIYLAMCFDGGTVSFGFKWYPYDLMNNLGHYSGALAGLVLGLAIQVAQIRGITEFKGKNEKINKKQKK